MFAYQKGQRTTSPEETGLEAKPTTQSWTCLAAESPPSLCQRSNDLKLLLLIRRSQVLSLNRRHQVPAANTAPQAASVLARVPIVQACVPPDVAGRLILPYPGGPLRLSHRFIHYSNDPDSNSLCFRKPCCKAPAPTQHFK